MDIVDLPFRNESIVHLTFEVPQADDGFILVIVFEIQLAEACWSAIEESTRARLESQPAGRDHASNGAAGKRQDISTRAQHMRCEAVAMARAV